MFKDIGYGFRAMARNPGVTATAVLTLALGIGANTAMFSVVNAVLLRPLPYTDPGKLVTIRAQIPGLNIRGAFVDYNLYGDWWRTQAQSFQSMAAFTPGSAVLTMDNNPERMAITRVNAGFLSVLGVQPALGRDFEPKEDQPGAPGVAILSHKLWKRRFGGDRLAVGRTILLNQNSYTVVGILPPGFDLYGPDVDLYLPIAVSTARGGPQTSVGVIARLKPGVSVQAAQAEIGPMSRRYAQETRRRNDWSIKIWPLRDFLVRDVRSSVVVLGVAVLLVLLIACANVANLMLVRAGARRREIAIRGALGAGAARIITQLLTENTLLAALAGVLGIAAAWAGVRALAAASAVYLPLQSTVSIDVTVLCFAMGAALLTILLFGLAPALSAARTGLAGNLNDGDRGGGEGMRGRRLRSALVVGEVALALLLAIGATLTARSLIRLQAVDPGFSPDGVLKATLTLPAGGYPGGAKRVAFFTALMDRVHALPGVASAGMVSHLPFSNSKTGNGITAEGAPPRDPGDMLIAFTRVVDSAYFQTVRARLVEGRFPDARDDGPGPLTAIVNETMARRCWPNQAAAGKRFAFGGGSSVTVVGVIADMRQTSLADDPDLDVYLPFKKTPGATMSVVIRTSMDPMRLAPALRAVVGGLDKNLALAELGPLTDNVTKSVAARRFSVALLGAFAVLALLLAAVGIYGVISYSVTRRSHEIGVRMALGAERGRIAGMVVAQATTLGAAGVVIGAAGGLALTRLLRSMLFGVSATDPVVFVCASVFLLAVAALAGYIPARRAAHVDPNIALRHE